MDRYLWRTVARIVLLIISPLPLILLLWHYLGLDDTTILGWCVITVLGNILLFFLSPLVIMWDMGRGNRRIRYDPEM